MSAGADIAAIMAPLSRMEILVRRLDLGSRQLGYLLMEISALPGMGDKFSVKDALDTLSMHDEQIEELDQLVQNAFAAVRLERQANTAQAKADWHSVPGTQLERRVIPTSSDMVAAADDPGTVFLAAQAAFSAGEIAEAEYDAAYERVDKWQPATPLEFTRKALCLMGDGGLPEKPIMDRLMEQAARLAVQGAVNAGTIRG